MTDQSALVGQVVTATDHVILGAQFGNAGFDQGDISDLIGRLERTVFEQAKAAGKNSSTALLPVLLDAVVTAHRNAALEIYRQICDQMGGLGTMAHRKCANIAYNVSQQRPRLARPSDPRLIQMLQAQGQPPPGSGFEAP